MFTPFTTWNQFITFMENIDKIHDEECWPWKGEVDDDGYGVYQRGKRLPEKVHELSWELFGGTIPTELVISQTCGNKLCANPKHLQAIINKEEENDYMEKPV